MIDPRNFLLVSATSVYFPSIHANENLFDLLVEPRITLRLAPSWKNVATCGHGRSGLKACPEMLQA
jgi:hypothetical protein